MKKLILVLLIVALLIIGCGVKQDYVDKQIADAETRANAKISAVGQKTDANAAEVARLQTLANELSKKTDLAINKAAGFENYQIIWSGEINFGFDSYNIDDVAAQILTEAGEKLESNKGSIIEITGHTDKTGSATYNYLLGEKRSQSAKRYLAERFGVSLYRMFVISYGKDKPIAMPDERNASSKNRRVTLTIWGPPQ